MMLLIDTADSQKTKVGLKNGQGKEVDRLLSQREYGSQVLIGQIKEILKRNKITLGDLTGIEVNVGPGSFTGLRVGISVANTLGHFLNIPINKKKGRILEPIYIRKLKVLLI